MLLGGCGESVIKNGSQVSDLDKWINSSVSSQAENMEQKSRLQIGRDVNELNLGVMNLR